MYKALIEPNLATGGFAPTTGYAQYSREASFGIGLQVRTACLPACLCARSQHWREAPMSGGPV